MRLSDDELVEELMDRIETKRLSKILKACSYQCRHDRLILMREYRFNCVNYLSTEETTLHAAGELIAEAEQRQEETEDGTPKGASKFSNKKQFRTRE